MPDVKDYKTFATANAIQVKIDNNIRMLAELHARWEREDKIAEQNSIARVYTITTTSNADVSHVSKSPTINGTIHATHTITLVLCCHMTPKIIMINHLSSIFIT